MSKIKEYKLTLAARRRLIDLLARNDKEFVRFLKEMRIFRAFFRNMKKSTPCDSISYAIPLEDLRYEYINWGLVWRYTPEGHLLWDNCNRQWKCNDTPKTTDKKYLKQAKELLSQIIESGNERI